MWVYTYMFQVNLYKYIHIHIFTCVYTYSFSPCKLILWIFFFIFDILRMSMNKQYEGKLLRTLLYLLYKFLVKNTWKIVDTKYIEDIEPKALLLYICNILYDNDYHDPTNLTGYTYNIFQCIFYHKIFKLNN